MAKRKATKRTWRWVTRDREWSGEINIHSGEKAPEEYFDPVWGPTFGNGYACLAIADFKKLFGFTPKKGSCVKMKFSAEVVK